MTEPLLIEFSQCFIFKYLRYLSKKKASYETPWLLMGSLKPAVL